MTMLMDRAIEDFTQYLDAIERSRRTIEGYANELGVFNRWLQERYNCQMYLEDVTTGDVEGFLRYLKTERKNQASTRRRYLASLRSFFKWAKRKGLVERNVAEPIEPIKPRKKEKRYLTEAEVQEFLGAIEHPLVRVACQVMYYTGLRISECLNLRVGDVDLDRRVIRVVGGKGNKDRTVPVSDRLHAILSDYVTWRVDSEYFLATRKTGRLSVVRVETVVRETVRKLGWEKGSVTPHSLRHAFASHLVRNNVNLVNVQKLLGHSSLKTTSVYTHSTMDDLQEAVNVF